ncbi:DsbA family protein [Pseudomonas sp. H3(2019)]|uniref:DsbA family protein n=1 Tax=Pseudomonas sp. H3(2019) TaxID=2598724 RepID=UPI0021158527|nr:DsbA family protein [Pseudomonas sp. H3(2019)]
MAALAGLLVATFPLIRDQLFPSHPQGPWIFGRADARWTITEFADLECPFCKTYTPILKAWVQQQDDVNLQWHHLPLDFHGQPARQEARLVECAGKLSGATAFWEAIGQVFERTRSNGQGFDGHLDIANVDNQELKACAANNMQVALRIDQQVKQAAKAGIQATPSLVIRDNTTGKSLKIEGPADNAILLSAIDWLSQANASPSRGSYQPH